MPQYLDMLEIPDYGPNPWSGMAQGAQGDANTASAAAAGIPGAQQNIAQSASDMQAYAQSTSYPTMPNDYNLGSQNSGGSQSSDPGASSRGFNPWSLKGEALSR